MYQKIKNWIKNTYNVLKSTFKEVDKLTDDELTSLLASKIAKRNLKEIPVMSFEKTSGQKMEFMTAKTGDLKGIRNIVKSKYKQYLKESKSINEKNSREVIDFTNDIADLALINREGKNFNLNKAFEEDLLDFYNELRQLDTDKMKRKKDVLSYLKENQDVRENRAKANITEAKEAAWLKEEGVPSGKFEDAPESIRREWSSIVLERANNKKDFQQNLHEMELLVRC